MKTIVNLTKFLLQLDYDMIILNNLLYTIPKEDSYIYQMLGFGYNTKSARKLIEEVFLLLLLPKEIKYRC